MENYLFYTDIFVELLKAYSQKTRIDLFDIEFLSTIKGICLIYFNTKDLYMTDAQENILEGSIPLTLITQIANRETKVNYLLL